MDGCDYVGITKFKESNPSPMQKMRPRVVVSWQESLSSEVHLLWNDCNGWEF